MQVEGAVLLQNMIVDPELGFAYLADEVGMGKTYVALGVVAMLRYFNPMLRVLYICPSRNAQEKWEREYKGFIRNNVQVSQGRIRTREGRPAAPYRSCRNVVDLLHDAASGYYADFFIGKDSFSIGLNDDESVWKRKRDQLKAIIPAHEWDGVIETKYEVKEQYARALNYVLPTFDLVIIDEAHNFKHDFESSDRNKVLSGVLGFREGEGYFPRVRHAILLSATPYDRNLNQLRNQLKMVGRPSLLPEEIDDDDQELVRTLLKRFMVRRLNTLSVNGEKLTRNMYRREWRKGTRAEILLETDEQKLVTALVQKKVGEMLTRQSESPSFQAGLLASFESFAESTRSPPVEFDGDRADKQTSDAEDRHVIGQMTDNYVGYGLGRTLPHPKMDSVCKRLAHNLFEESNKQLVFVRRVKSVNEIKDKLDGAYNDWIKRYIDEVLSSYDEQREMMGSIYQSYCKANKRRDDSSLGGEIDLLGDGSDVSVPAKSDTFFAWFFRGETLKKVIPQLSVNGGDYPTPDSVRKGLSAKNQVIINLMEPNWAWYLCRREGLSLENVISNHGEEIAAIAGQYISGRLSDDHLGNYQACQIAFIKWMVDFHEASYLTPLYKHLEITHLKNPVQTVGKDKLFSQLILVTLYTELETAGLAEAIIPHQARVYNFLKERVDVSSLLKLFDIHKALMSFVLRTAHGIIDIYLARLKQGPANLTIESRGRWLKDFVAILISQRGTNQFSTYHELQQLSAHLELIIKNNIPHILELNRDEYPTYIRQSLNPVSPVIGASGETSGRSSQARKFRMPGYPLALVTTDVFQEGEDLHTFCDSVVHYGLSGSPVALEQKTGRVDRVSSMAQRRLMVLERQAEDDEFIQVTFPYVKESIETLQIRQICLSLNEFIESLHDVSVNEQSVNDLIDVDAELLCKDEVPDQILTRLRSPYTPAAIEKNEYHAIQSIEKNERRRNREVEHVYDLLNQEIEKRSGKGTDYLFQKNANEIPEGIQVIRINSAKASGELLLSLTRHAEPSIHQINNSKTLMKLMHDISWCTFHRTFAIECSDMKGCYQLHYNAEMLVGGSDVTQHTKIEKIFERMQIKHDPDHYKKRLPDEIVANLDSINVDTPIPNDRSMETSLRVIKEEGLTMLEFDFGGAHAHRTQRVMLYECDGRCVFMSRATKSGFAKQLKFKDVIKYTWMRNRNIDLVEFVVDPESSIVGRVVHPVENMQWDEFIYCAYTLAVEVDALEYLLSKKDVH
ncbi:MAG: DEAD/DEAH box helicase family protein [gamma proteobacterium endosymbiont of Lamellibrachia anaximandri]|nr:DEAD/DEAH box helicase family protein [gamma proteobacterium endosymbiont of Lamellibrachia anaximandri]MBL3535131.1 DEAD/DEAH box helicase family protein [gamma proteobacterium endosymbiont of Lamellibrachia anaximandri]